MRITKLQSRIIAVGVLVAFFIAVGFALHTETTPSPIAESGLSSAKPEDLVPRIAGTESDKVQFSLENFHRSEMKNDKKIWEIAAKKANYSPESQNIILQDALITLYDKAGNIVTVSATQSKVFMSGASISKAELKGNVKLVRNNEVVVETESAVYNQESNTVKSSDFVRLTSPTLDVSGTGMDANLTTKEVKLLKKVTTIIRKTS